LSIRILNLFRISIFGFRIFETFMAKGSGGFLIPDNIIKEFGIKEGMRIADFGCGAGYFTIPIAKSVGENGVVYALDVLKTSLESVRSKAKIEGLLNIKTVWANLEISGGSKLKDESSDIVSLANILFQSPKKADIIEEAKRILKKKGKMIIIEWQEDQPLGPPKKLIVSKNLVQELVKKQGFKLEKEFSAGKHHWGMVFVK